MAPPAPAGGATWAGATGGRGASATRGERDAGNASTTDAKASTRVATIDVPETSAIHATYAGAVVVTNSAKCPAAAAFPNRLAGTDRWTIPAGFGLLPASG